MMLVRASVTNFSTCLSTVSTMPLSAFLTMSPTLGMPGMPMSMTSGCGMSTDSLQRDESVDVVDLLPARVAHVIGSRDLLPRAVLPHQLGTADRVTVLVPDRDLDRRVLLGI